MNKLKRLVLFFFCLWLIPMFCFADEKPITLYLFHGDGCPHCAEEMEFLTTLENDYPQVEIVKYEVWYNEENANLLTEVQKSFDLSRYGVPTTVIGNVAITGYGTGTPIKIRKVLDYYLEHDYIDQIERIKDGTFNKDEATEPEYNKEEKDNDEEMTVTIPIIGKVNLKNVSLTTAAVVVGFIDGFNPCAMWVLLFLISVLIGMKDRKRMWILGLSFLLTSALIYMLIMLSWISIVVKMTAVIWIRNLIAIIALVGGIWNLRSFFKSNDSGCEVVDDKRRKSVFKKIRKFTSEKSFFLALIGVIGLAVSVNLVELACSAGLPLVFSELLVLNQVSNTMKFLYTFLYILFFLIDDFIVFFIAMFTMKVTGISTKYNKYSHLLGGLIMIIIGLLLFIKPEWLMFQFK